ncbi:MAG: DUF1330 domain-containing protein [Sulfuritalea sp.]|nr:DUF1330 domain-containing protein [Sulfuritalea sp.]
MSKPAYMVVDARSSDPDRMLEYRRLAEIAVSAYGGRYLVRGSPYETQEGNWHPQRLVVLEFPSMEIGRKFYDSPEYVEARKAREGVSNFDMLLVEGL